jgi:hypothetical protein
MVSQPGSSLSLLTSCFRTRISHLRGRLAHLTTLSLFTTDITISHNQKLHELLDRIEHIASLEVVDRRGQEKELQDDMDNMAQGAHGTDPSLLSGRVCCGQTRDRRREYGYSCCLLLMIRTSCVRVSCKRTPKIMGRDYRILVRVSVQCLPLIFIIDCPITCVIG